WVSWAERHCAPAKWSGRKTPCHPVPARSGRAHGAKRSHNGCATRISPAWWSRTPMVFSAACSDARISTRRSVGRFVSSRAVWLARDSRVEAVDAHAARGVEEVERHRVDHGLHCAAFADLGARVEAAYEQRPRVAAHADRAPVLGEIGDGRSVRGPQPRRAEV